MIYVYFGEFLSPNKRDIYLLSLEIFWVLGMVTGQGKHVHHLNYIVEAN